MKKFFDVSSRLIHALPAGLTALKNGYHSPLTEQERDFVTLREKLRDGGFGRSSRRILVRRGEACGDVLLASGIAPALKKKTPGSLIFFQTRYPSVLAGNRFIDYVITGDMYRIKFDEVIDLNLCYERRPTVHIMQCYADAAEVSLEDCCLDIGRSPVQDFSISNYVVMHAGYKTGWPGRVWELESWAKIATHLRAAGVSVVCIGTKSDYLVPCDWDSRGLLEPSSLASLIAGSRLFIGIDSMPFHVAQAVNTASVVYFGSILPELRIINGNVSAVAAKGLTCLGCHHRGVAPRTETGFCETGTKACESGLHWSEVWEVVRNRLGLPDSSPQVYVQKEIRSTR